MKAFQRALALLLALITVLTLTACGQKPAAQPEQVQEPAAEQSKPAPAEEPAAEEASDAEQTPLWRLMSESEKNLSSQSLPLTRTATTV